MLKIILQNKRFLIPFNEVARDLRIQNKPLWLIQRDVLSRYTDHEIELPPGAREGANRDGQEEGCDRDSPEGPEAGS